MLQAQPRPDQTLDSAALDRSENIIRNRIDKLGVSEPEVRKQGDNQIVVQLAGVFDQQRAVSIIGSTAALELYKLEDDLLGAVDQPGHAAAGRAHEPLQPARAGLVVGRRQGLGLLPLQPEEEARRRAGADEGRPAQRQEGEMPHRRAHRAGVQEAPRRRRRSAVKGAKAAATTACRRAGRSSAARRARRSSPATTARRVCPGLQTKPMPGSPTTTSSSTTRTARPIRSRR